MPAVANHLRHRRRQRALRRWLKSLGRLPVATAISLGRWFGPGFRLKREARRLLRRSLPLEQLRQLEQMSGRLSPEQGMLLAYLAAKAPAGGQIVHVGSWERQTTAWLAAGVRQREDRPQIISFETPEHVESGTQYVQRIDAEAHRLQIHRMRLDTIDADFQRPIALVWFDASLSAADSGRIVERFLPSVQRGGWAACAALSSKPAAIMRSPLARSVARRPQFRAIATVGQIELFRRQS